MQKKKSFQLRTVHATGWIDPKTVVTLHSFFNNETKSNTRLKTHQSPRKKRIAIEEKQSNLIVKNTLATKSERKSIGTLTEPKSNLKQFPKRQSLIKNGNAFRYFMHSTSRIMTEVMSEEQIFFKKLDQIIKDGPYARTIQKFDSIIVKDSRINSKQRKKWSVPKQTKRRFTLGDNYGIQPWRFKQEQDFNDLHIQ